MTLLNKLNLDHSDCNFKKNAKLNSVAPKTGLLKACRFINLEKHQDLYTQYVKKPREELLPAWRSQSAQCTSVA